jgi:hypothetical protein
VFENRVLRRNFRPKRDEVREKEKFYNEELHIMNMNKSRIRQMGYVASMVNIRNTYKILVESLNGRDPLERSRCKWEDEINTDLKETVCEGLEWVHLSRERDQWRALVNTVMKLRFP